MRAYSRCVLCLIISAHLSESNWTPATSSASVAGNDTSTETASATLEWTTTSATTLPPLGLTTVEVSPVPCKTITSVTFKWAENRSKSFHVPGGCSCLWDVTVTPSVIWNATYNNVTNSAEYTSVPAYAQWNCVTFNCSGGVWTERFYGPDHGTAKRDITTIQHVTSKGATLVVDWTFQPFTSDSSTIGQYMVEILTSGDSCQAALPVCPNSSSFSNYEATHPDFSCVIVERQCSRSEDLCSRQCLSHSSYSSMTCRWLVELAPLQNYSIFVWASSDNVTLNVASKNISTPDAVPEGVASIVIIPLRKGGSTYKRLMLSWTRLPSRSRDLWYCLTRSPAAPAELLTAPGHCAKHEDFLTESSIEVPVNFHVQYRFTVKACSSSGCSPAVTREYTPKPGKPKAIVRPPREHDVTTESLSFIMVNASECFDWDFGGIAYYTVAVVQGSESTGVSPAGWYTKRNPDFMRPLAPWTEDKVKNLVPGLQYVIGKGCSSEYGAPCEHLELIPEQKYCIFIVGYTSPEAFTNSSCIAIARAVDEHGHIVVLVLGIIFALVAAAAVVALTLVLLRRRKVVRFRLPWERNSRRHGNHGLEMSHRRPTSRPILLKDFESFVRKMHEHSNLGFSKEFHDVKCFAPKQTCEAAVCASNLPKNRYADIMPFDHSRVHLITNDEDEYDGSDYINANYIPGFNSPREYIATQGPLPATVDDFWRMVWEQHIPTIVMLTGIVERGSNKCEQYWPAEPKGARTSASSVTDISDDVESKRYGEILVTRVEVSNFESYNLTVLEIEQMSIKRRVNHFFYHLWPDMSCPHDKDVFINFVEEVRLCHKQGSSGGGGRADGPMLIHCSAGVGRTGTFIAVDTLLQHIVIHPDVDVLGTVINMRKHRCRMVQTEDQYIFIHDCIANAISALEQSEPPEKPSHNSADARAAIKAWTPHLEGTEGDADLPAGHVRSAGAVKSHDMNGRNASAAALLPGCSDVVRGGERDDVFGPDNPDNPEEERLMQRQQLLEDEDAR